MAQLLCCFIPVIKLPDGQYLIGSRIQALEVSPENEVVLAERQVRLEDYLTTFGVIESLRLDKVMHNKNLPFKGVVQLLLRNYGGEPSEVAEIVSRISQETEIQFDEIVHLVKDAQTNQRA